MTRTLILALMGAALRPSDYAAGQGAPTASGRLRFHLLTGERLTDCEGPLAAAQERSDVA
jgi:hypothetical protein